MTKIINIDHARELARKRLPKVVYDYVDGYAGAGSTGRANSAAFESVRLRSGVRRTGNGPVETGVDLFGRRLLTPVLLAPCGMASMVYPGGPICAARAAEAYGTVAMLSTVAGVTARELRAATDEVGWFQLYAPQGRAQAGELIREAAANDFRVLVVTVDTSVLGIRYRDRANGVAMPMNLDVDTVARLGAQFIVRPRWCFRFGRSLGARRMFRRRVEGGLAPMEMAASPFSLEDLAWIRDQWSGPMIAKGVLEVRDVLSMLDLGIDGFVVSNHGGRQLDGSGSSLAAVPMIRDAVGERATLIVDSGVRSGADVLKALCLGADAVAIGRPWLYGAAVDGQAGIEAILGVLKSELVTTMQLMGVETLAELDRNLLTDGSLRRLAEYA